MAQGLGFIESAGLVVLIKFQHEIRCRIVRHRPERGENGFRAPLLSERGKTFDFLALKRIAVGRRCRVAGGKHQQFDVIKTQSADFIKRVSARFAAAEQQKRIGAAARFEAEMAGNMNQRKTIEILFKGVSRRFTVKKFPSFEQALTFIVQKRRAVRVGNQAVNFLRHGEQRRKILQRFGHALSRHYRQRTPKCHRRQELCFLGFTANLIFKCR